jgi:hypothetical protein
MNDPEAREVIVDALGEGRQFRLFSQGNRTWTGEGDLDFG